jgi:hypothetical protein
MRQVLARLIPILGSYSCVLVGLLLLTASLLKLRSLVIVLVAPGQGSGEVAATVLSVLLVALEFTLGALLLLALASRRIVDICLGLFSLFACYNLWVMLEGRSVCDCFGVVRSTPRVSLLIDLGCIAALFLARRGLPQVSLRELVRSSSFRLVGSLSVACVTCCMVVLLCCENSAALAQLRGQPLRVTSPELAIDEGEVGEVRPTTLWITNCVDRPIRVLGGTSKCNCNVTPELPLTIGPRETRAIPAVYKLPAGTGWFEVPFVVYHDVEEAAPLQGRIVVHVR